ncbi:Smr/MutS family protein [Mycoplasma miroungirhinis]|uniref:Smr/MutS family protein n=1 Tax=Mycoplasma miroungirhinis TaxID=754516 RepID=A0A6M4JBN7_9MOLU|nr:Smr/MutS family protein [Mycoplasma miroungirhinis]QJR44423.1 Smr/MutS family protein [Mycoplasma miroungirhinis]
MKIIDLHGYNITKATAAVLNALFEFDNNSYENSLEIITGNGTGSLKLLVSDILDKEGYYWKYNNSQQSSILVLKNKY